MTELWMRESLTIIKGAIEKFKRGEEGDYKQALIMADNATETIMRHYLAFKCNQDSPFGYLSLLKTTCEKTSIPAETVEKIEMFRLIRDGFYHQDVEKIRRGLKGTTSGLTIEKSYLEDYLQAVCQLFELLTKTQIKL